MQISLRNELFEKLSENHMQESLRILLNYIQICKFEKR